MELANPGQIIETGNRFAGAGCPVVLKHLTDPDLRVTALSKVLKFAGSLYESAPLPSRT